MLAALVRAAEGEFATDALELEAKFAAVATAREQGLGSMTGWKGAQVVMAVDEGFAIPAMAGVEKFATFVVELEGSLSVAQDVMESEG